MIIQLLPKQSPDTINQEDNSLDALLEQIKKTPTDEAIYGQIIDEIAKLKPIKRDIYTGKLCSILKPLRVRKSTIDSSIAEALARQAERELEMPNELERETIDAEKQKILRDVSNREEATKIGLKKEKKRLITAAKKKEFEKHIKIAIKELYNKMETKGLLNEETYKRIMINKSILEKLKYELLYFYKDDKEFEMLNRSFLNNEVPYLELYERIEPVILDFIMCGSTANIVKKINLAVKKIKELRGL